MRFYVPFNSIIDLSGRSDGDTEILCAIGPGLQLERFPPPAIFETGATRLAEQGLTYYVIGWEGGGGAPLGSDESGFVIRRHRQNIIRSDLSVLSYYITGSFALYSSTSMALTPLVGTTKIC